MAEEHRTGDTGVEEPIQNKPTTDGQHPGGDTNTGTKKRRTRTGTNSGTNTGTEAVSEKEVIPGMAPVTDNEVPKPKPATKKRTRTGSKKNDAPFNAEQISTFILTMSGVLATSEGGKYFALSPAEAEQLAKPLANLIAKNDSLNGLGEHSDSIALLGACALIFIPRLIGYLSYVRAKNKDKTPKLMIKKEHNPNGTQTANNGSNRQINEPTPLEHPINGESILSGLPSIV